MRAIARQILDFAQIVAIGAGAVGIALVIMALVAAYTGGAVG